MTKVGTKKLIEDFIDQICQSLEYIADNCDDQNISVAEKIVYFNEIRHVLGRTALCLSGGGSLGAYHVGVVLAMHRNGILPKIITGSSVGSIVSALVCTKPDEELEDLTKDGCLNLKYFDKKQNRRWITGAFVRFRRFWQTGFFMDVSVLRDCVRDNIGDITFLEAYQKTGRILNITVSGVDANTMPRLLNFLTAPNVVIWSAVIASCAIPFVFEPQELFIKSPGSSKIEPIYLQGVTFSDGSVSHDLPMNKLSQLFNVDNFVVSQVNPHLVPFLFHSIVAPIPLFERLFRFLAHEFHLYTTTTLVNLREAGILRGLVPLNSLLTQKYTGDVTIVPDVALKDYMGILSNPSLKYIQRCSRISSQSTWKHVSRLQGLCAVEFTIDRCLTQLRSQLVLTNASSFKKLNRISSFQAPTKRATNALSINTNIRTPSSTNEQYDNHLHIPQNIYSQMLQNNGSHQYKQVHIMGTNAEADIDDMNSVVMDEDDIGTTPISDNKEEVDNNLEGSQSSPQLKMKKRANNKNKLLIQTKSNSSDSLFVYGSNDANDSNNSLHKSVSVAELCSDFNITNTV